MENKSLVNGSRMALNGLNGTRKADGANNCAEVSCNPFPTYISVLYSI